MRPPNKKPLGSNRGAFKNNLQKESYRKSRKKQGHFDRALLPAPDTVLQRLGILSTGKVNSAGYLIITCPFHKNGQERNPSLNLHAAGGYYRCHSCDAHGGDILAFYMAVTGKGFRDAARDLGAWRDGV